jgi:hypothetical protein
MVHGPYDIKIKQITVLFFEIHNLYEGRPLLPPPQPLQKEKETQLRYWSYGPKEGI